jgi:hypothetical protein
LKSKFNVIGSSNGLVCLVAEYSFKRSCTRGNFFFSTLTIVSIPQHILKYSHSTLILL